jgi:outer membrane protein
MKKIVFGILMLSFHFGIAQNLAYIETEKIVEEMPAYKQAADEIDEQIITWETEVEAKFKKVEELYQSYVKNESIFPDDIKQEKQEEIIEAEKQAKKYREEKFGQDGELQKLQEAKMKPLQDTIMQTATKIAKEKGYDYVFDKSQDTFWIYTNPEHDLTEFVKTALNKGN